MKVKAAGTPGILRVCAALAAFLLAQHEARALPAGAAPQLVGLGIATPAGDVVEISSSDESLRGVAMEAVVSADTQGVEFFELEFTAPDGRKLFYAGDEWTITKRDYLLPTDRTRQTYQLNEREIRGWYGPNSEALNQVGTWNLTGARLQGFNGQSSVYGPSDLTFPAAVKTRFEVTRWFSLQPSDTVLAVGATLTLSASMNPSAQVPGVTYQWLRNGVSISGATAATYTKTKAVAGDSGLYQLVVTSGTQKVRSDAVVVSVRSADVIAARAAINAQNSTLAKTKAGSALAAAPSGGEELFVSSLSELFALVNDTRTTSTLKAFGVSGPLKLPLSGLVWSGTFLATANTSQASNWITQVLLPALDKADANLAKITDTRFVTNFATGDFASWRTSGGLVRNLRVDYGDIQMLRVGCNGLSALLSVLSSVDTSVKLDVLQALFPQGKLSMESILKDYPNLLAAASGGAAFQAKAVTALGNGASAYMKFSNFVYPSNGATVSRLIDSDSNFFPARANFSQDPFTDLSEDGYVRDFAKNVTDSIASGTKLFIAESSDFGGVTKRYPVNLKAVSARPAGMRSVTASQNAVPPFTKNLAGGTIATQTLTGVLPNLSGASMLARIIKAEPEITKALGTRDDQSAPVLILTDVPVNGNKVLLTPDSGPIRLSGTVQDESEVTGVFIERSIGTLKDSYSAELEELQPVIVGGKTVRTWRWSLELSFEQGGPCSLAIYAVDQYKQKSVPKLVNFTVAKVVRVLVDAADVNTGTLTVTPALPVDGLVEMGTKLHLVAAAKPGYLFRLLEVVVNGVPEDDISRSIADVVITGETVITPQFIVNPFPALAGQWNTVLQGGRNSGLVSLTLAKTGAYTVRVTSGRNSFSYSGTFDASGLAKIPIPANFTPYGAAPAGYSYKSTTQQYAYLSLSSGIDFSWNEDGQQDSSYSSYGLDQAANAALAATLPSKRYTTKVSNETDAGFSSVDVGSSGSVVYSGIVNVSKSRYGIPVTFFRVSHPVSSHGYQRLSTSESIHITAGHSYKVTAILSADYQYVPGDVVEMFSSESRESFTYRVATVGDHQELEATVKARASYDGVLALSFYRNAANQVVEVGHVVMTDTTTGEVLTPSFASGTVGWEWDSADMDAYREATVYNALPKPVRFTASSYLSTRLVDGMKGERPLVPFFNFYGVGSPTEICVGGYVILTQEAKGTLSSLPVLSGPLDPNRLSPTFYQWENSYEVQGYPYNAPKTGKIPLPFIDPSVMSFNVSADVYSIGVLSLAKARPSFQFIPGTPVVKSASLSLALPTGAFSGNLSTKISGVTKARAFSGVLLQGGPIGGIGLTADGLEISFQP